MVFYSVLPKKAVEEGREQDKTINSKLLQKLKSFNWKTSFKNSFLLVKTSLDSKSNKITEQSLWNSIKATTNHWTLRQVYNEFTKARFNLILFTTFKPCLASPFLSSFHFKLTLLLLFWQHVAFTQFSSIFGQSRAHPSSFPLIFKLVEPSEVM